MTRFILRAATWASLMPCASGTTTAAPFYKCSVNGIPCGQQWRGR